jgi:hypothetical protein
MFKTIIDEIKSRLQKRLANAHPEPLLEHHVEDIENVALFEENRTKVMSEDN